MRSRLDPGSSCLAGATSLSAAGAHTAGQWGRVTSKSLKASPGHPSSALSLAMGAGPCSCLGLGFSISVRRWIDFFLRNYKLRCKGAQENNANEQNMLGVVCGVAGGRKTGQQTPRSDDSTTSLPCFTWGGVFLDLCCGGTGTLSLSFFK